MAKDDSLPARIAQLCILVVVAVSLAEIVVRAAPLSLIAAIALAVYFALCWRLFTLATWVPILLSVLLLGVAAWQGTPLSTLAEAVDRMAFLSSLLALLGMLRIAAGLAPETARAGRFLTSQPPGRRYLAMNFGGHVFGVLINLGGLAILLEMVRRSLDRPGLTPTQHDWRLRRMTTATLRGFSLVPLWSPFGFGMNAMLLAMPGLSYWQVGPVGLTASLAFLLWGWFLDWRGAPAVPSTLRPPQTEPGDGLGVILLVGHVALLGTLVFALHAALSLSFQQALLLAVPVYSLGWVAVSARRQGAGAGTAISNMLRQTLRNFPRAAGEIGVFASAGLLAVLALAVIPVDQVQVMIEAVGFSAWQMVVLMSLALFVLATVGVNPIITASILAALVSEVSIPGLSLPAAALTLAGAWSCVMGFTPAITTVAFAGALVGRPAATVGIRWNGLYCLTALLGWTALMALAVGLALI